ncbi:hypothetical protein MPSEU_000428900 [Mayamaea pseudoterrestris]|nr:hypothetical protein MPSEU_000428900 [Mayamaea pseudoterrestris]
MYDFSTRLRLSFACCLVHWLTPSSLAFTQRIFVTQVTRRIIRVSFASLSMSTNLPQQNFQANSEDVMEEREKVYWCPEQQIYVGGVPEADNAAIERMIQDNHGFLRIFGYGSLCWNPGTGILADASVTNTLARAKGYRRCWAQKSTDHRGTTIFPGIVCTLLTDEEFHNYRTLRDKKEALKESMTEGLVYVIPPLLVKDCLAELDFREKGGYARDVIDVVVDETGETVQCLLYRGTPDNPAFWPRALQSLTFAAAVIAAAEGPSGSNETYLHCLRHFLDDAATSTKALASCDETIVLTRLEEQIRTEYSTFFFAASGSNQHNQLLLSDVYNLVNGEDAYRLTESVLAYAASGPPDPVVDLVAGTGHSGAITASGRLFLFGWNEHSQLGTCHSKALPDGFFVLSELDNIRVAKAALGFSHTVIVTKDGRVMAFGDDSRGQVTGIAGAKVREPHTPTFLVNDSAIHVAAGLYHSAVVTVKGDLIVFGCSQHGQSFSVQQVHLSRWKPDDALITKVACGRYHTVALDSLGRLWSFGDNRYGQLGRTTRDKLFDANPQIVSLPNGCEVHDFDCGWSHTVALTKSAAVTFGWGRTDRGQLGFAGSFKYPTQIFKNTKSVKVVCGSESTVLVDERGLVWVCGWNEHGNLATGDATDRSRLAQIALTPVMTTPGYEDTSLQVAVGGAHLLIGRMGRCDRGNVH